MSTSGRPRDTDIDDRIVEATRALLDEHGVEGVTLAAVAREAGVSRPALYRRYPDADSLLVGVLAKDLARLVNTAPPAPSHDPVEQLMAQLEPFLDFYAAHPERSRALMQAATFARGGPSTPLNQLNVQRIEALGQTIAGMSGLPAHADPRQLGFIVYSTHLTSLLASLHGVWPDPEAHRLGLRACIAWTLRLEPGGPS